MLATDYAKYYGIPAQGQNETDLAFRSRVAGALRDMGHLVEAHEAQQDQRYEDSDEVMTGITGAIAQALQGRDYGRRGEQLIGDDIAAGYVAKSPPDDGMGALLAMMMTMLGDR